MAAGIDRPRRTAKVFFPFCRSLSISRRLLMFSTAVASRPQAVASRKMAASTVWACEFNCQDIISRRKRVLRYHPDQYIPWAGAHRVGDGGLMSQASQGRKPMKSPTLCQAATQQRQTKRADEYDGDDRGALHLLGVITFLHPAQRRLRSGLSLPLTASP